MLYSQCHQFIWLILQIVFGVSFCLFLFVGVGLWGHRSRNASPESSRRPSGPRALRSPASSASCPAGPAGFSPRFRATFGFGFGKGVSIEVRRPWRRSCRWAWILGPVRCWRGCRAPVRLCHLLTGCGFSTLHSLFLRVWVAPQTSPIFPSIITSPSNFSPPPPASLPPFFWSSPLGCPTFLGCLWFLGLVSRVFVLVFGSHQQTSWRHRMMVSLIWRRRHWELGCHLRLDRHYQPTALSKYYSLPDAGTCSASPARTATGVCARAPTPSTPAPKARPSRRLGIAKREYSQGWTRWFPAASLFTHLRTFVAPLCAIRRIL